MSSPNTSVQEPRDQYATQQPVAPPVAPEDDVRNQIWSLVTTLSPKDDLVERRREQRYPFPYLVYLTPVGDDGISPDGETIVVVGKHLSECGLGFYHPQPLPYRRMIVSLQTGTGAWLGFLIDLNWCRFTKQGWYESGGRFLRSVLSPIDSDE